MSYTRSRVLRDKVICKSGRLMNQYVLDMYSRKESLNFNFYKNPSFQRKIQRIDEICVGNQNDESVNEQSKTSITMELTTTPIIKLPSSHPGSPGYQQRIMLDGLALVRDYGNPHFFITVTINPNWVNIKSRLEPYQNDSDRPDVTVRSFNDLKKKFIKNLTNVSIFGVKAQYIMWTVEFHMRGNPHVHIAMRLDIDKDNDPKTIIEIANFIDKHISAEIPNDSDRVLKDLVERNMIQTTNLSSNGFPIYRRRNNCDRMVVPYNSKLLRICDSRVNVEYSKSCGSIAYLYKYMTKGTDKSNLTLKKLNRDVNGNIINEIDEYARVRVVTECEAMWRGVMDFDITSKTPSVITIPVYIV